MIALPRNGPGSSLSHTPASKASLYLKYHSGNVALNMRAMVSATDLVI